MLDDMIVFTPTQLTTERLALRWLDKNDAAAQFALFSDPGVMEFIAEPWTQLTQAEDALEQALASYRDWQQPGLRGRAAQHWRVDR
jgi:RimJ/RimL family protein N-acetyltransferase